jgi:hypothetical protein
MVKYLAYMPYLNAASIFPFSGRVEQYDILEQKNIYPWRILEIENIGFETN